MATPKIQVSTEKLLKRMKRYEEVTGKSVSGSLRRGARLLAVNMAFSTPPHGKNSDARKLGERAVQNDILRVYRPTDPIKTKHGSNKVSFREEIALVVQRNHHLRDAILGAISMGNPARLNEIFQNVPGFGKLNASRGVDPSIHASTRNAYGRVRRGWRGREIVMPGKDLERYIAAKQALVGISKAGWASAAMKVNADVKDALSGIPAWVKRHVEKVSSTVKDASDGMRPLITLTSKVPWADKALRKNDQAEAIRISRQKFFVSMGKEIRFALKAQQGATV